VTGASSLATARRPAVLVDLRWSQGQPAGPGVYIRDLAIALNESMPVRGLAKPGSPIDVPFPIEVLPDVPRFRFDLAASVIARRRGLPLLTISRVPLLLAPRQAFPIVFDLTPLLLPATHPALRGFLERATYPLLARANTIITISATSRRDLIDRLSLPAEKICVVTPALGSHTVAASPIERLHELGVHRPFVLAVGTLEPRKNHSVLVKAFSGLLKDPSLQLVFAGGLGWRYGPLLREMAPLQKEERLVHTGYVSERDKALLYQQALCVVCPNLYDGFSLPALESMAHGTPVIISNTPACLEVTGDAGIAVDPRDTAGWASAIRRLSSDGALRGELSRAGRARAAEFSWRRSVTPLAQRLTRPRSRAAA
jgi:glycosyltransferase involved in cell wall biosynthesis